ncbi:hypothetical protein J0910_16685 [Nocardiopsis sp. CNT-189]|uniref:condensation domain-containing protein n=1 Tax=Nocardiopsis oceanisediminis TaxID=2816862 RepID=UPI003B2CA84A
MLQAPITELDIAPGHVIEWRLRPSRSPGASEKDDRSSSYNQEKHFSAALDARADDDPLGSYVACTFELPGPLDRAALEAALLYFVRRHEVLRCEFRHLAGDLTCRPMAAEDAVLDPVDIGPVATREGVRSHVDDCFHRIDTLSWPLLVMGAVVRPESTTVFLGFDHLVSDGLSTPIAVNDIATAYTAAVRGEAPEQPEVGSYLDFSHRQRLRHASVGADDARLDHWKAFMRSNGGFFPPFPLDLGVAPGQMYGTVNDTDTLLTDAQAEAFEAHCRKADGKVFMGMLAAVGESLRREGGPEVYRGLMPVSDRGRGRYAEAMGWFVNTMPIEFPVPAGADFAQVMAGVRDAADTMRKHLDVPFVKAWKLLAPEYADLRSWPYAVNFFSYLDFRRTPGGERQHALQARKHVWASHSNGICFWFHRNETGMHVNSIYADTPQAHRTKAALTATLTGVLAGLADSGEF